MLSPEQERVVTEYLPLVAAEASRLSRRYRGMEYSDLCQDGSIGLIDAVLRADPERPATFSAFAKTKIRGAMIDGLRRGNLSWRTAHHARAHYCTSCSLSAHWAACTATCPHQRFSVSLDVLEEKRMVPELQLVPGLQDHFAVGRLRTVLRFLRPNERRVLLLMYYEDWSQVAIAELLGRSESWVSQLHQRVLRKLRQRLTEKRRAPGTCAA